jgi:DNA recombination protein RmuC
MEIALIVTVAVALVLAAGLALFYVRAREDAVRAQTEIEATRRLGGDAERLRQDTMVAMRDAAKAASLEAAQSVSSKLLDDHKRETEAAKKESEERVRAVSETLVKNLGEVTKAVAGLQTQVKESGATVDLLKRVLENPGSAGAMSEIVLANTLKSFGLEEGRDYLLQQSAENEETGNRLRPDAVVFLPGDKLLVIDCKASKFLLDIAAAEGTEREADAYANFGGTMNQHLRALSNKDYRSAVLATRRRDGHEGPSPQVHMMMFLPTDSAMAKLTRADESFRDKARREKINVGGPDVLYSLLSVASAEISFARQVENHERIVERMAMLLDGIVLAIGKAGDVGKNLKRAAESFDDFSRSTNRFLLPRARNLVALGLKPKSEKPMPGPLPAFSVHAEENIIEGEAEELPLPPAPPRLVK